MLSPDYLYNVSDRAIELYEQLNTFAVKDICRRLVNADWQFTGSIDWQLYKLQQSGMVMDDIVAEVAKISKKSEKEIADIFKDATYKSQTYDNSVYKAAGLTPIDIMQSPQMLNILQATYRQTLGELRNFTQTTASAGQAIFMDAMDEAYFKIVSGQQSYTEAIRQAVDKIASGGLFIHYFSGHKDTIETAVRRCVLTGVSQATARVSLQNAQDMDTDLVLVSAHLGARPSHAKWQGKIYSISGRSDKYKKLAEATGYGTVGGLCGANCRHHIMPFIGGISNNPYDEFDEEENQEYYENQQEQRKQERNIRTTKREMQALKESIDATKDDKLKFTLQEEYNRKKSRLSTQMESYEEFSKRAGLPLQKDRLRVANAKVDGKISTKRDRISQRIIRKTKSEPSISNAFSIEEINRIASNQFGFKVDFSEGTVDYAKKQLLQYEKLSKMYRQDIEVVQIDTSSMFGRSASAETFISPDNKYATISLSGKSQKQSPVDRLHSYTVKVDDANVNIADITHEFAHTISSSKGGNEDFWKEIKSIKYKYNRALTKIDKDNIVDKVITYDEAIKRKLEIFISEYANKSIDEFMAEAFSDALLSETSSTYSKQVLDAVDKYFKKNSLENIGKSSTIELQAEINKMMTQYERDVLDAVPKKEGFFDFAAHGTSNSIAYGSTENVLSAREVANIIRHNESYNGEKVRLLSCNTGSTENGFAQQLANALGVEVEAPSDILYVRPDGKYWIGQKGDGKMNTFKPRKED